MEGVGVGGLEVMIWKRKITFSCSITYSYYIRMRRQHYWETSQIILSTVFLFKFKNGGFLKKDVKLCIWVIWSGENNSLKCVYQMFRQSRVSTLKCRNALTFSLPHVHSLLLDCSPRNKRAMQRAFF